MNLIKKILIGSNAKILPLAIAITLFGVVISNNYQNIILVLSGLFTIAFIYLLNTSCDIEEDKINEVNNIQDDEHFAIKISLFIYLLLSLLFSFIYNILSFLFVIVILLLGFFYSFKINNFRFKNILVIKNLITALGWCLLIFVGSSTINALTISSACLVFMFIFTASTIADVEDIKGDLKVGIITIPSVLGIRRFSYFILLIQCVGLLLILFLILYGLPYYLFFISLIFFINIFFILYNLKYCVKNNDIIVKSWRKTTAYRLLITALIIFIMDFVIILG